MRSGYDRIDGQPLGDKNPKWLQDDYVKFLRFAQRKIDQAGEGIVAFVTSHGYLDNPTFRGLRQSLLATFDEIHLLDLHGNGKKKERAPDGSADANVFAGRAAGGRGGDPGQAARPAEADVRRPISGGAGPRKLRWLGEHDVETTGWTAIEPRGPAFLFAPRDAALEAEYGLGVPLTGIFPEHSVGIITGRDAFAIDTDPAELGRRVGRLRSEIVDLDLVRREWGAVDRGRCRLEEARRKLRSDPDWQAKFRRILFRPFDWRKIFYADYVVERPRSGTMKHLLIPGNLGLVVPRQRKEDRARW